MGSFRCKKCNVKNSVHNEWVEEGVNRLVHCHSCGHKMNLKLKPRQKNPDPLEENQNGTVVLKNRKVVEISLGLQISTASKKTYFYSIPEKKTEFKIYFGRNPSQTDVNDQAELLFINDPFVSRLHGVITIFRQNGETRLSIHDNKSSNGTLVNDSRLEDGDVILLAPKDRINIGNTIIQVEDQRDLKNSNESALGTFSHK